MVSFGDGPAPVGDEIIANMQAQSAGDGFVEPGEGFEYGDTVKIEEGPFGSLTGIVRRVRSRLMAGAVPV